jgi:hypothetical protein
MPGKRPNEPIGPANVPGGRLNPRIPDEQSADNDENFDERVESDEEQHSRDSEKAFDQAIVRTPPS